MLGFMIYCAGMIIGIVMASWIDNWFCDNNWQKRVTAKDLEALGRLFDAEKQDLNKGFKDGSNRADKFYIRVVGWYCGLLQRK